MAIEIPTRRADELDRSQLPLSEQPDAYREALLKKIGSHNDNSYGVDDVDQFHKDGERSQASRPDLYED